MEIGKTRLFGMQRYHIIVVCIDFLEFNISIVLLSGSLILRLWEEMYILELSASCKVYF